MAHVHITTDYDAAIDCDVATITHDGATCRVTIRRDMPVGVQLDSDLDTFILENIPSLDVDMCQRIIDHIAGAVTFARESGR